MSKLLLVLFVIFFHFISQLYLDSDQVQYMSTPDYWRHEPRNEKGNYMLIIIFRAFIWAMVIHIPIFVYMGFYSFQLYPIVIAILVLVCTFAHMIVSFLYVDGKISINTFGVQMFFLSVITIILAIYMYNFYVIYHR